MIWLEDRGCRWYPSQTLIFVLKRNSRVAKILGRKILCLVERLSGEERE